MHLPGAVSRKFTMVLYEFMTFLCIRNEKKIKNIRNKCFRVNPLDIAPQHASVIMGISNTFATIPGIISPTLTGFIVLNSVRKISIEVLKDIFF